MYRLSLHEQGSRHSSQAFLEQGKKIPQHPSVRIDGAQISTFLVSMAAFLGVVQSSTLCARIHTPRKEKFVQLQARVAHDSPPRWLKPSKASMLSTLVLSLVWVTPFVPLAPALTAVWNLTLVISFVNSCMLGQHSISKNAASMVLGVMLMSKSVPVQGPFVTSS